MAVRSKKDTADGRRLMVLLRVARDYREAERARDANRGRGGESVELADAVAKKGAELDRLIREGMESTAPNLFGDRAGLPD